MASITLFQDSEFKGPYVTLTKSEKDFKNIPFNDKISSALVESGVWQIFVDSDFNGNSVTLAAGGGADGGGKYPTPNSMGGYNDKFSSIKLVGK